MTQLNRVIPRKSHRNSSGSSLGLQNNSDRLPYLESAAYDISTDIDNITLQEELFNLQFFNAYFKG